MQITAQWLYSGRASGAYKTYWWFKGSDWNTDKITLPILQKQCQNQTNLINTQTGCIGIQPEWRWSLLIANIWTTGWTEREYTPT